MADHRRRTPHTRPCPAPGQHEGSRIVRGADARPAPTPAPPYARDPSSRHRAGQDGNALVLMPIGVLVVLLLAGLAVDTALLYRAQAELDSVAAALANDAASAVDTASLFDDRDDVAVDPGLLANLASLHQAASGVPDTTCDTQVDAGPEPAVRVTCRGAARTVFRSVAGLDEVVDIETTESADLHTN